MDNFQQNKISRFDFWMITLILLFYSIIWTRVSTSSDESKPYFHSEWEKIYDRTAINDKNNVETGKCENANKWILKTQEQNC
jgi:hypothetical protein